MQGIEENYRQPAVAAAATLSRFQVLLANHISQLAIQEEFLSHTSMQATLVHQSRSASSITLSDELVGTAVSDMLRPRRRSSQDANRQAALQLLQQLSDAGVQAAVDRRLQHASSQASLPMPSTVRVSMVEGTGRHGLAKQLLCQLALHACSFQLCPYLAMPT